MLQQVETFIAFLRHSISKNVKLTIIKIRKYILNRQKI